MPFCNSNSLNGNSAYTAVEDRVVRSLPWVFRVPVPGFEAGWPPR
jgi:hypothetical protein